MNKFIEKAPEIIREAAKSTLGVISLIIISLSLLALAFFTSTSEYIRVGIFILIFIGAGLFLSNLLNYTRLEKRETTSQSTDTERKVEKPKLNETETNNKDNQNQTINPYPTNSPNGTSFFSELKHVLSEFQEFESNRATVNFLNLTELNFYVNELPLSEFGGKLERIESILSFFASKELFDGRPSLIVFINSLMNNLSEKDSRKSKLRMILAKLQNGI